MTDIHRRQYSATGKGKSLYGQIGDGACADVTDSFGRSEWAELVGAIRFYHPSPMCASRNSNWLRKRRFVKHCDDCDDRSSLVFQLGSIISGGVQDINHMRTAVSTSSWPTINEIAFRNAELQQGLNSGSLGSNCNLFT